jgi:thioredoxin
MIRWEEVMAGTAIKEVTASEFSTLISKERPVLADFSATWCGPCKAMLPIVERLAARFDGQAEVVKVDIDQASELALAHGVRSVPTFLLFVNGQVAERIVGSTSESALATLIESQIPLAKRDTARLPAA